MKFQNSSIHGFKVMLCIKKRDERTDGRTEGRTDGRTDGRTNNPEAICPSNFFEVGGITTKSKNNTGTTGLERSVEQTTGAGGGGWGRWGGGGEV